VFFEMEKETMIPIIAGPQGACLTTTFVRNAIPEVFDELPERDQTAIREYLDGAHGGLALIEDDSVSSPVIVAEPGGKLRFHPRLHQELRKKNDDSPKMNEAYRSLVREALRKIPAMAAAHKTNGAKTYEMAMQAAEGSRQQINERIEVAQELDAFYLIEQLTKRVEKLEAKR
jgi:hypothetical protein